MENQEVLGLSTVFVITFAEITNTNNHVRSQSRRQPQSYHPPLV
jgi:hypothetical protein